LRSPLPPVLVRLGARYVHSSPLVVRTPRVRSRIAGGRYCLGGGTTPSLFLDGRPDSDLEAATLNESKGVLTAAMRMMLQTTSNNPAAPMPPPIHIVTTTSLTPRRRPSINACAVRRGPDTP